MKTFAATDTHGRRSIPGMHDVISADKERAIKKGKTLFPKPRNSYSDPYTYYHVTDILLWLVPGEMVKTKELVTALEGRPLTFDPITVGRVIADIAESLELSNGKSGIQSHRWWDGVRYWTTADIEDRAALEHLLEDLRILCDVPTDGHSPLRRCPSLLTLNHESIEDS